MITCHRKHLVARCRERGYTLDQVRQCIVSEDGDMVTVDENHRDYPRSPKARTASGPGTELKALLKTIGITASPGCSCNKRAAVMDEKGCDWVEANEATVVGWLREEATKRKLPFLDVAGRILVRKAIRNARKKQGH